MDVYKAFLNKEKVSIEKINDDSFKDEYFLSAVDAYFAKTASAALNGLLKEEGKIYEDYFNNKKAVISMAQKDYDTSLKEYKKILKSFEKQFKINKGK